MSWRRKRRRSRGYIKSVSSFPQHTTQDGKCCHTYTKQVAVTPRGYKMKKVCVHCNTTLQNNVSPPTTFEGFIRRWVHGKLGKITKVGNYHCTKNRVYYVGGGRNVNNKGEETLAIKLKNGEIIGNASMLQRCGSYSRGTEAPAQQIMQQMEMAMIPFNVFDEAGLNIQTAKIVHATGSEKLLLPKLQWNRHNKQLRPVNVWKYIVQTTKPRGKNIRNIYRDGYTKKLWRYEKLDTKNLEKRHFVGAMVLQVQNKQFLFDVDRREVEHYRFNAFLSELPVKVTTVEEAYDSLIPPQVKKARKKGKTILRQGEWFFIPTTIPKNRPISSKLLKAAESRPQKNKYGLWEGLNRYSTTTPITDKDIKKYILPAYREEIKKCAQGWNKAIKKWEYARKRRALSDIEKYAIRGRLQAGNNRPNFVEKYVELQQGVFIKGKVTHSGREHEPITLKGWHTPVPNLATKSFTIQGNID